MGATRIDINVVNFEPLERRETVKDVLVDTGADITILPREVLERLNIEPYERKLDCELFDGTSIKGDIGFAIIEYAGRRAVENVVFGTDKDKLILGVVALETMGLRVNPGPPGRVELGPPLRG